MTNRIDKDSVQILINSRKKPYLYGTVAKGLWLYINPGSDKELIDICYDDLQLVLSQIRTKEELLCLRDNSQIITNEEEIL